MPLPTVSFVLGIGVLLYLATFVFFALLRIITGVSIQRISYSGLRRIAFSPRDGISIRIRGIGVSLHRPTFAQPTWISLTLTEPRLIIDLAALKAAEEHDRATTGSGQNGESKDGRSHNTQTKKGSRSERVHMFEQLMRWKDRLKRLHRQVEWLRNLDLVILRASIIVKDVGSVRMERFTLSVDTRSKTVDRSRLFQHHKTKSDTQRPAEWISMVMSILLTVEGNDSVEILDYCTISVHGFLHKQLDGLRDASIALKMGRVTIPYDDFESLAERLRKYKSQMAAGHNARSRPSTPPPPQIKMNGLALNEDDTEDDLADAVDAISDSREFADSTLRGIREVQLAVGFFGLSKGIKTLQSTGQQVYFNMAMKEVGLDLLRLDPNSPAHRMYFSHKDVAHQALLTAISISVGVDDGHEHPERMVYVPMITATIKTTLPSKILQVAADPEGGDRANTNILFANLVCTSPSVDIDPKHFPLLLAIVKAQTSGQQDPPIHKRRSRGSMIISKLLPKATIKIAIQEPVIRVSLSHGGREAEYDMIISSVSSISVEIDAQHDVLVKHHYSLSVNYRHTTHRLYGQTFEGVRHELLFADTVEIKLDIRALPQMSVSVAGRWQDLSLFLVQHEICEGLRQIVLSLRKELQPSTDRSDTEKLSFLRRMPPWLQHVQLEGSDFSVEVTGVEPIVSQYSRGICLRLESWSTEYKADREEIFHPVGRRRSTSRASSHRESSPRHDPSESPRRRYVSPTDGRRLAVHIEGLEGLIIDSIDRSSGEQWLWLPRFEVAFSTTNDPHGPIFHVNSKAEKIYLNYSLYNHFAAGIAYVRLKRTFMPSLADSKPSEKYNLRRERRASLAAPLSPESRPAEQKTVGEITTIDFRAGLVQVKATMPADPPLMVQIFQTEAGRHRWATPFMRTKLARLYTGTPNMKRVWSRIISVKTLKLDLRTMKRKVNKQIVDERSLDLVAEAIRLSVPHQLVVHSIFDNITNVIKVTEQLRHQFTTGTNEYVLEKHPEGPKHVPRVSLRSQVFIFEIEDSPFEYKLGIIYRTGLLEQRQRLAREEAFRLKAKRMNSRRSSIVRTRSARPANRDRESPDRSTRARSHSNPRDSRDLHSNHRRKLRFDAEGVCDMDGEVRRTVNQARDVLNRFNGQSWRSRIDRALATQRHAMRDIRAFFFGIDEVPEEAEETEPIMASALRPALFALLISDFSVTVDKPSFPLKDLPHFMHDVGKGMPLDMQYGLLIPMHLTISMAELRGVLRDYPLPALHIPTIRSGQAAKLPAFALTTNFVIAEEFRDKESQRHVDVEVVPMNKLGPDDEQKPYKIVVRRTISPVKTYSNMKIDVNTSAPTRIAWGTSYQPAIQDLMQVIEGFTKPPIDPSDRVGFWDKIRLSFHSRILVSWKEDGDVRLLLKGSRDPYVITGDGAGLCMIWRNNVVFKIAQDPDPRKFMTVDSGDYILAVPDYDHYARHTMDMDEGSDDASASQDSIQSTAIFKKVIMKLSGNVQWLSGLVFEQGLDKDGQRQFNFKPHYEVVLKHPDYAKSSDGKPFDAFKGFRSQHIHMSMAVSAPQSRDWSAQNVQPSDNYNSVHLTPRFLTHFLKWWSLFSGVMSLPVRQGPLWGSQEKSSKKFGRHLATIKYNLLLSPVFISHMYKHKDAEDFSAESVAVTGLKMKINSFMLDLHQRREYFDIPGNKDAKPKRTSSMKINQGLLDLRHGDFRAVSASIRGTSKEDVDGADENGISTFQNTPAAVDLSRFTIPDNDFTWIDMDDFVELDWILPQESNPETKILPLGSTPRFTWFRQTDHGGPGAGDSPRESPFGDELTHYCVMSRRNDPRRVQADLIQKRLDKIVEQMKSNEQAVGAHELKIIKDIDNDQKLKDELATLQEHAEALQGKHAFLNGMLQTLHQRVQDDDTAAVPGLETQEPAQNKHESDWRRSHMAEGSNSVPMADESRDFNNRFVVHNAQIKWNNSLRNIMLRYIHQVGQRRGFVYYMSRRAVKFILDIIEEKKRSDPQHSDHWEQSGSFVAETQSPQQDDDMTVEDRIEQILADGRDIVEADDDEQQRSHSKSTYDPANEEISTEYVSQNSYHFRLIAPQIQLQSEKNPKSVVLIAAKGMHLKVIQIMDKDRVMDEVSGLVQRRFNAAMDSMQVFVATTKSFSNEFLHMYSGNRYGARAGTYWPPWVPMEVMYEFSVNPFGFSRVVQRTSASLRYDKYNNLRLKYNDDVSKGQDDGKHAKDTPEHRMDHLTVEFPQFRAICDSPQYYAMYLIVMDLLLYSEPLQKTRSERLEKIMLASDFSDLTGAPEMVAMLQRRIRQLEEIKMHFQIHEKLLDRQGWKDRISMEQDLTSCEDELFFMMKAITTSQQKADDRGVQDASSGILNWYVSAKELAWHLVQEHEQKFLEFQIRDTSFERTDNSDGSNQNKVEFGLINGFNYLPNAVYHELIAPYDDEESGMEESKDSKMLRVQWLMLEAIAGIPVVDTFEVQMVPVRVQLEREVAKKLFEYIFPGVGGTAFEGSGFSPFMVKKMIPTQEEEDEALMKNMPEPSDMTTDALSPVSPDSAEKHQGTGTGAGTLEARLQPTLRLHETKAQQEKQKHHKGLGIIDVPAGARGAHWSLFNHKNRSTGSLAHKAPSSNGKQSKSHLSGTHTGHNRTSSTQSVEDPGLLVPLARSEKKKGSSSALSSLSRKSIDSTRPNSKKDKNSINDSGQVSNAHGGPGTDDGGPSDDLTQMLSRASSYMTLSYFHIHSLILCLTYKGQGKRNIEDVHDLVFRLPAVEYRNKTWSNLDLAMELKREVLKALVGHAGRIVGNKLRGAPKKAKKHAVVVRDSLLLSNTNGSGNPLGRILTNNSGRPRSTNEFERQSTDLTQRPRSTSVYRGSESASTRGEAEGCRLVELNSDDDDSDEDKDSTLQHNTDEVNGNGDHRGDDSNNAGVESAPTAETRRLRLSRDESYRQGAAHAEQLSTIPPVNGSPPPQQGPSSTGTPDRSRQRDDAGAVKARSPQPPVIPRRTSSQANGEGSAAGKDRPQADVPAAAAPPSISVNGSPLRVGSMGAGGDASETRSLKDSIRRLSVLGRRNRSSTVIDAAGSRPGSSPSSPALSSSSTAAAVPPLPPNAADVAASFGQHPGGHTSTTITSGGGSPHGRGSRRGSRAADAARDGQEQTSTPNQAKGAGDEGSEHSSRRSRLFGGRNKLFGKLGTP